MSKSNGLYALIGALIVIVAVGGYYFYRQQHQTGIDVNVNGSGVSIKTN
ncbi:hypothetical protein BH10PSE7_BH10PSE7_05030 [soil metagenome]